MKKYNIKYIVAKLLRRILNPPAINHSALDRTAKCDSGTSVSFSTLGKCSYVSCNTSISHTDVGAFTSIGANCVIGGGSHPVEWVSTSPAFHRTGGILKKKYSNHEYKTHLKTLIGNDVWIGANCSIKSGITISDGAVIGMGSVVTHDVGAYEIWVGNPAHMIRKRFSEDDIERLLKTSWWEWDEEKLLEYANLITDIQSFIEMSKDKEG